MIYIITILISVVLIIAGNMLLLPPPDKDIIKISLSVIIGAAGVFSIDGISAFIIRRLTPKSWYMPDRLLFQISRSEVKIYQKLDVKSWPQVIPELGVFTGFHKDALVDMGDSEYLKRFIYEANYGIIIHLQNALCGFLIVFLPGVDRPTIWIPIYIVNFVLSMLPVLVLRFNNYTLIRLYRRSLRNKK